MARRRSNKADNGGLLILGVVAASMMINYWEKSDVPYRIALVAAVVALVGIALLFFAPTRCGYPTRQFQPCRKPARGLLRGCGFHRGFKVDVLWAAAGVETPRVVAERRWHRYESARSGAPVAVAEAPQPPRAGGMDRTVAWATIFSAFTSVAVPVIQGLLA